MATLKGSCLLAAFAAASLSGCAASTDRSGDRQLFAAAHRVTQLEQAIDKRSQHIQGMQQELQRAVDALTAPDTATTGRLILLERTRSLSEEQGRLQGEIARLNGEVIVKRAELEALRHAFASGDWPK
jgi:chromosome segregation ATPase